MTLHYRAAAQTLRLTRTTVPRPALGWSRTTGRMTRHRGYADHGSPSSSSKSIASDIPWALGAVLFTFAGISFLRPKPTAHSTKPPHEKWDTDGHDDDEGHDETPSERKEELKEEDEAKETEAKKKDGGKQQKGKSEGKGESDDEDDKDEKDDKDAGKGNKADEGKAKEAKKAIKADVPASDAKHRSDPHQDTTKSRKHEGVVETAKLTGTVDPARPAK